MKRHRSPAADVIEFAFCVYVAIVASIAIAFADATSAKNRKDKQWIYSGQVLPQRSSTNLVESTRSTRRP